MDTPTVRPRVAVFPADITTCGSKKCERRNDTQSKKLKFAVVITTSRDSVVGIVTGHGAGLPRGRSSNHFFMSSRLVLEPTQPPIQWVPGALSPGVKRPGREDDNSPPSIAEVKKTWVYTSTAPYVFMV
jgi:hypothetical protein